MLELKQIVSEVKYEGERSHGVTNVSLQVDGNCGLVFFQDKRVCVISSRTIPDCCLLCVKLHPPFCWRSRSQVHYQKSLIGSLHNEWTELAGDANLKKESWLLTNQKPNCENLMEPHLKTITTDTKSYICCTNFVRH